MARRLLAEVRDELLRCRSRLYGHAWDDNPNPKQRPRIGQVALDLRCTRCTAEVVVTVDVHGRVLNRSYVWPEGYKEAGILVRESGVTGLAEYRREIVVRRRKQPKVAHAS